MTDPFKDPSEGGVKITDYEGNLLLVSPTEYKTEVPTSFGEKDCVVADIVVLDSETGEPEALDNVYMFQGKLIGATKSAVGKGMVLGRLSKEPATKPGYSPAWILKDASDEDKQTARDYLAKLEPFSAPA